MQRPAEKGGGVRNSWEQKVEKKKLQVATVKNMIKNLTRKMNLDNNNNNPLQNKTT